MTLLLTIIAGSVILIVHPERATTISITPGHKTHTNQFGLFGAVNTPGYYTSEGDIRIAEAVAMAGGLAENADDVNAHLSKWINDGETIIIPTAGIMQPTLTPVIPGEAKVDLNSADKAELMSLPGIGEKKADDILKLREERGKFTAPEDILVIPGIGEKLLESIYDRLIVK